MDGDVNDKTDKKQHLQKQGVVKQTFHNTLLRIR